MSASFQFVSETHEYFLHGERKLSVTQILNETGLVCYDHIPAAILDRKAEIGTAAHAACHYFDEGDLDESSLAPEVRPYVEGWKRFRRETDFVPKLIEYRGIATVDGMQYGFTLDRDGILFGKPVLLEIKCTAGVEFSWGPQTAAYEMAVRELEAEKYRFRSRIAVHLRPNGNYQLVQLKDPQDYAVFKSALLLTSWKERQGKTNGNGSRNFTR